MLNHAQERAVRADGHLFVSACPGSGKTRVLAERAVHLLSFSTEPRVLAVTFTADAAAELAGRIHKGLPGAASRVIAGTFHKLAKDQLTAAGQKLRIASDAEVAEFVRAAAKEIGKKEKDVGQYIQIAKSLADPKPAKRGDPMPEAVRHYNQCLIERGLIDCQDLLIRAVEGMRRGTIPPLKVDHALVDEIQDADGLQWAWIMCHVKAGTSCTVVGDDDQSIYGWRAATGYPGMQQFVRDTHAQHIALDMSYRCASEILDHAARVIAHNNGSRVVKALATASTKRGTVRQLAAADPDDEASMIATSIETSGNPGDWAVLARDNIKLEPIDKALKRHGVPFERVGGTSFWELAAPSLFLGVLNSLDRGTFSGFEILLNKMKPKPTTDQMAALRAAMRFHDTNALDQFCEFEVTKIFSAKGRMPELQSHIRAWRKQLARGNAAIPQVCTGVEMYIESSPIPNYFREGVQGLGKEVARKMKRDYSLRQRLLLLQEKPKKKEPHVQLMTMHKSKGLEFNRVWIARCEDGVVPDKRSPDSVDEERRLFYVAMTRAKVELVLSHTLDDDKMARPSPFILDAGIPS